MSRLDNSPQGGAIIIRDSQGDSSSDDEEDVSTGPNEQIVHISGISWLAHALKDPSVKKRRRTILVALALLIAGIVLLLVGIIGGIRHDLPHSYISFFVIGIICLLPGVYYVYVVVKALRKVPGFTLEAVPDYD